MRRGINPNGASPARRRSERASAGPMQVTNPYYFFGAAGLVVAYLLYISIRKRKGERPGSGVREPEL